MKNLNIIEAIARASSDLFEKTGNASPRGCVLLALGEPEYSIELLMDDSE